MLEVDVMIMAGRSRGDVVVQERKLRRFGVWTVERDP